MHIRATGKRAVPLEGLEVVGHACETPEWTTTTLEGPGHAIARVRLEQALSPSELLVVKLDVGGGEVTRSIYAHRRAFADRFPIGTWTGTPETYALLRRLHIDTIVKGGRSDDPFYSELVDKYGFHTMVHTGLPVNVDMVRDLGKHPAVDCWMLQDEPDWSIPPNIMLFADRTVRAYNKTKPTFITLCRNIKFFEYAPISDIPCMDHYAVTAPSSSRWPKFYGTHLEETAYYTRDLKYASEPKPIWIWSQAIADWTQRPKRPVPTPAELAAQLMLNLGRGAKGILWFNYDHEVAEQYPDVRDAMRDWGRVMYVLREDFLGSEPVAIPTDAPKKVDVAALTTWDKLLLCATNLDYEIDPEAYPFETKRDVKVKVRPPSWIRPKAALRVSPAGVESVPLQMRREHAVVTLGDLEVCDVVVLVNDPAAEDAYKEAYAAAIAEEQREF